MLAAPAAGPCAAARARIGQAAAAALGEGLRDVEAYRSAWRDACDPDRGPADLSALLGDADALVSDVRLGRLAETVAATLEPGAPWPLPGVRRAADGLAIDWDAFGEMAARGKAEDARFFRGLSRTVDREGEPVWLGPAAPGGARCVRLAETSWVDVATGLEEMDRAGTPTYARRAAQLRERLVGTLQSVARGAPVCGCTRGDPLPALDALAARAQERGAPPSRRAVTAAARDAAQAVRTTARIDWLRAGPDAPATGCGQAQR